MVQLRFDNDKIEDITGNTEYAKIVDYGGGKATYIDAPISGHKAFDTNGVFYYPNSSTKPFIITTTDCYTISMWVYRRPGVYYSTLGTPWSILNYHLFEPYCQGYELISDIRYHHETRNYSPRTQNEKWQWWCACVSPTLNSLFCDGERVDTKYDYTRLEYKEIDVAKYIHFLHFDPDDIHGIYNGALFDIAFFKGFVDPRINKLSIPTDYVKESDLHLVDSEIIRTNIHTMRYQN